MAKQNIQLRQKKRRRVYVKYDTYPILQEYMVAVTNIFAALSMVAGEQHTFHELWGEAKEGVNTTTKHIGKRKNQKQPWLIPPSHRRCCATAVLVRHKPHWHRHARRGSAVVPSLIAVPPRKTVKTAGLRDGTAET